MIASLRRLATQTWAMSVAEWLRMLTTPAWAALLVLWTLVCGLFFQVVVTHAAHNELPAGETPLSSFFRFFPGLLPLLLVVFVPQLTMDLLAGRRERGRLEQLQLAGTRPLALVLGGYLAVCAVLLLLAVPILLFHLVLAGTLDADPGATLGGVLAVLLQASTFAAISIAVSAWMPTRLSAGLVACALGLIWWILDLFAPAVAGAEAMTSPWHRALALSDTIHDFAGGLLEWRSVIALLVLDAALLLLARLGLSWRAQPLPRLLTVAGVLLAALATLELATRINATTDLTWDDSHGVAEHTLALVDGLAAEAPMVATLIATPGMRNDPVDGPLVAGVRTLFQRLEPHGLRWNGIDPERSPREVVALRDRLHLADRDLRRPLVVVEHLDRHAILPATRMGAVEERDGQRRLAALDVEGALVEELQRLHGALPTAAWIATAEVRPVETPLPHHRSRAVGAWRRQLAAQGWDVRDLAAWESLEAGRYELVVVPGVEAGLPVAAISALREHLRAGGHLLLALDAEAERLTALASLLADYGLGWSEAHLAPADGGEALELPVRGDQGPAALVHRARERVVLPRPVALTADQTRRGLDSIGSWLPAPSGSRVVTAAGVGVLEGPHPTILTSRSVDAGDPAGRIALLGSAQALADGDIHRRGNRLLAVGLADWLRDPGSETSAAAAVASGARSHLEPGRLGLLRWLVGLGVPLLAAGAGWATWWWRRRG